MDIDLCIGDKVDAFYSSDSDEAGQWNSAIVVDIDHEYHSGQVFYDLKKYT